MLVRRLGVVLLLMSFIFGVSSAGAQSGKQPPTLDPGTALLKAQAYVEFVNYIDEVNRQNAILTAIHDTDLFLQSLYVPPAPPVQAPRQTTQYVSNNGAHSDAWWRGVSVCEQGGRNDPYFGYFSIMDGSAGGLDWSTQVAMANAIIARAGDGAWAASCQAAGYAASPSG